MKRLLLCLVLIGCGRGNPKVLRTPGGSGVRLKDAGPRADGGGPVDGGGFVDSGRFRPDTGVRDTGVPGCEFPFDAFQLYPDNFGSETASGPGFILESRPLIMAFDDGREFFFDYEGPDRFSALIGRRLFMVVEIETPWWTEAIVGFFEQRGGQPGRLIGAAWTNTFQDVLEFSDRLSIEYVPSGCTPMDWDGCGDSVTLDALVRVDGVERARIPPGETFRAPNGLFGNGRSFEYVGGPGCTDTPPRWIAGFFVP